VESVFWLSSAASFVDPRAAGALQRHGRGGGAAVGGTPWHTTRSMHMTWQRKL
jgi:hypothetical protein